MTTVTDPTPATNLPVLLTPREVAKKLRCSYGALALMRHRRRSGLRFIKLGRKVLYRESDVQLYLNMNLDAGEGPKPAKRKGTRR